MKRQGGTASILRKREEKLQELGPAIEANEMKPLELKIKIETEHKKVDINISDEEMKMVHFYFQNHIGYLDIKSKASVRSSY